MADYDITNDDVWVCHECGYRQKASWGAVSWRCPRCKGQKDFVENLIKENEMLKQKVKRIILRKDNKKKLTKFFVKQFGDYHDISIDPLCREGYKTKEIGCFPVELHGCCRYFALFYKGKKPTLKDVLSKVFEIVAIGEFRHFRTGMDIGYTKEAVENKVRKELNAN